MDAEFHDKCQAYVDKAIREWGLDYAGEVKVLFEESDKDHVAWVVGKDWNIRINKRLARACPDMTDPFWTNIEYLLLHEIGHHKQREVGYGALTCPHTCPIGIEVAEWGLIQCFFFSTIEELTTEYGTIKLLEELGREDLYDFHIKYSLETLLPMWLKKIETPWHLRAFLLKQWPYFEAHALASRRGKRFYDAVMGRVYAKDIVDGRRLKEAIGAAEDYFKRLKLVEKNRVHYIRKPLLPWNAARQNRKLLSIARSIYSLE